MSIPAGTPMPDPVPKGRWREYAVCLGEGFCPSCRQPLGYAITLAPGVSWGQCWPCGCSWEYDRVAYSHVIRWRGEVNGFQWDIVTLDNDDVRGAAEWAE